MGPLRGQFAYRNKQNESRLLLRFSRLQFGLLGSARFINPTRSNINIKFEKISLSLGTLIVPLIYERTNKGFHRVKEIIKTIRVSKSSTLVCCLVCLRVLFFRKLRRVVYEKKQERLMNYILIFFVFITRAGWRDLRVCLECLIVSSS